MLMMKILNTSAYAVLNAVANNFAMSFSIIYLMSRKYEAIAALPNESEVLPFIFFCTVEMNVIFKNPFAWNNWQYSLFLDEEVIRNSFDHCSGGQ